MPQVIGTLFKKYLYNIPNQPTNKLKQITMYRILKQFLNLYHLPEAKEYISRFVDCAELNSIRSYIEDIDF